MQLGSTIRGTALQALLRHLNIHFPSLGPSGQLIIPGDNGGNISPWKMEPFIPGIPSLTQPIFIVPYCTLLGAEIIEEKHGLCLRSSPSSDGHTCKRPYHSVITALRNNCTKSCGNAGMNHSASKNPEAFKEGDV